jgi:predicted amidohydrolase
VRPVPFRVAIVQTDPAFGEVESNVTEALTQATRALIAEGGADLVVLPELFHTGYVFRSRAEARALAEDAFSGPTARALAAFCREHGATAVAGLCERRGARLMNSAVWVGPRGVRGVYRKVHLFFEEKLWFAPGREPWPVFRVGAARVGLMICFDWRFPEVARSLALAGADLIVHPSNLVHPYCQEAMRTRALENRVFCATANRVGWDRRPGRALRFTGQSQVVDPFGRVLTRASAARPETRVVDIDLSLARDKRVTARNDLFGDRVPGLYAGLARRRPAGRRPPRRP